MGRSETHPTLARAYQGGGEGVVNENEIIQGFVPQPSLLVLQYRFVN
jgi:hypothetical protein